MDSRDMDLSLRDHRVRTSDDGFAGSMSAEGKEAVMQGLHGGAQGHPRNKEEVEELYSLAFLIAVTKCLRESA